MTRNRRIIHRPQHELMFPEQDYIEQDYYPIPLDFPPVRNYPPQYPIPGRPPVHYPYAQPRSHYHPHRMSRAAFGALAIGWFLGAWLLCAIHPVLTLAAWFAGIGILLYRALK